MKEKKRVMTGEGRLPVRGAKRESFSRRTLLDHTTAVLRVSKAPARRVTVWEFQFQKFGSDQSLLCFQVPRKGNSSGGQSEAGLSQREEAILSPRRKPKRSRYLGWVMLLQMSFHIWTGLNLELNKNVSTMT